MSSADHGLYSYVMDMFPDALKFYWGLRVQGVIHAGAHKGEEQLTYSRLDFGPVTWIEAIPELAEELRSKVSSRDTVLNATLWSRSGEVKVFTVANYSGSSSLFEFETHTKEYPHVVPSRTINILTSTLDDMAFGADKNLLVLDLQGSEYEALQGAKETLKSIDYVISEVNRLPLYRDIKLVKSLDRLLSESGFTRVATRWTRHGWGEALFISNRFLDGGAGKYRRITSGAKILAYWIWLHFVEIPGVFLRQKVRELANPSKAR